MPTQSATVPPLEGVAPGTRPRRLDIRGRWFVRKERAPEGSVWPSRHHELLLRAGLLDGEAAVAAWRAWSREHGDRPLDPSSRHLLPLVYRNLKSRVTGDPRLDALKDPYRLTWIANQRIFHLLRRTLEPLRAAGIETLVFKGAALAPLYYRDLGARTMGDFDVLVPEAAFHEAVQILASHGWRHRYWNPDTFDTRFEHAIALFDQDGNSVDLHCHLLMASCAPGADDAFWEGSAQVELEGARTRTLTCADHLLQACVHGINWVVNPLHRWVADAAVLAREAGAADWDRLARVAPALGLTPMVVPALAYLERTFDLPVPAATLEALRSAPVSHADRRRFTLWTHSPRGRPVTRLLHHWTMYTRGLGDGPRSHRVTRLPEYLRFWAHTDRLWKIPPRIAAKAVRTLGYRLGVYHYWNS